MHLALGSVDSGVGVLGDALQTEEVIGYALESLDLEAEIREADVGRDVTLQKAKVCVVSDRDEAEEILFLESSDVLEINQHLVFGQDVCVL